MQKNTLDQVSFKSFFQDVCNKELQKNKRTTTILLNKKEEYNILIDNLKLYNKSLKVPAMIPFGNRAMFPGFLLHTNELMAYLGEDFFLKSSAQRAIEMCNRRVEACDELLKKLKKEQELLKSRRSFYESTDMFDCDEGTQIVEPYNEEEEQQWREKHRESIQRQKQEEKNEKEDVSNTTVMPDKELIDYLDALELQEELEDEMMRLAGLNEIASSSGDSDDGSYDIDENQVTEDILEATSSHDDKAEGDKESDDNNGFTAVESKCSVSTEGSVIRFNHSSAPGCAGNGFPKVGATIQNPTEIKNFLKKASNPCIKKKVSFALPSEGNEDPHEESRKEPIAEPKVTAVADIVRETTEQKNPHETSLPRPVSKFKQQRRKT